MSDRASLPGKAFGIGKRNARIVFIHVVCNPSRYFSAEGPHVLLGAFFVIPIHVSPTTIRNILYDDGTYWIVTNFAFSVSKKGFY